MIVRTKKYKLASGTYIRLGLQNIMREQWWVLLIAMLLVSGTLFINTIWFFIAAIVGLSLYGLFWLIQFYGITQLEQNQVIFERLTYEINSRQLMAHINTKQGMPIAWDQIKRARQGKNYFLLLISKAHLIYLPYKIFQNAHDIKFLETILKRKALLK